MGPKRDFGGKLAQNTYNNTYDNSSSGDYPESMVLESVANWQAWAAELAAHAWFAEEPFPVKIVVCVSYCKKNLKSWAERNIGIKERSRKPLK